jgi:heme-degrading monooxygenase HmoA
MRKKPTSYYAVIFTSVKKPESPGYEEMAQTMVELAATQPGFLGVESVRGNDGTGITVSYWQSEEAIQDWKHNVAHGLAQKKGRDEWYSSFKVRICKVEREYGI